MGDAEDRPYRLRWAWILLLMGLTLPWHFLSLWLVMEHIRNGVFPLESADAAVLVTQLGCIFTAPAGVALFYRLRKEFPNRQSRIYAFAIWQTLQVVCGQLVVGLAMVVGPLAPVVPWELACLAGPLLSAVNAIVLHIIGRGLFADFLEAPVRADDDAGVLEIEPNTWLTYTITAEDEMRWGGLVMTCLFIACLAPYYAALRWYFGQVPWYSTSVAMIVGMNTTREMWTAREFAADKVQRPWGSLRLGLVCGLMLALQLSHWALVDWMVNSANLSIWRMFWRSLLWQAGCWFAVYWVARYLAPEYLFVRKPAE